MKKLFISSLVTVMLTGSILVMAGQWSLNLRQPAQSPAPGDRVIVALESPDNIAAQQSGVAGELVATLSGTNLRLEPFNYNFHLLPGAASELTFISEPLTPEQIAKVNFRNRFTISFRGAYFENSNAPSRMEMRRSGRTLRVMVALWKPSSGDIQAIARPGTLNFQVR